MKAKSNRKRKIVLAGALVGAALVLASAVLVGSGAVFTSTSANPENVFTSGVLTQSNSIDGSAILKAERMKPGDEVWGQVEIANTGDIAGNFTLEMRSVNDYAGINGGYLRDALQLRIYDANQGYTVYEGSLNGFYGTELSTFYAGDSHTYEFTVSFPDSGWSGDNWSGDNYYQGSMTEVEFIWNAVQTEVEPY